MNTLNDVVAAAQALPESERSQLITLLWDNLPAKDWHPPSQEWIDEANKRSDAIDSGTMTCASWDDVRKRARRKAGLDD